MSLLRELGSSALDDQGLSLSIGGFLGCSLTGSTHIEIVERLLFDVCQASSAVHSKLKYLHKIIDWYDGQLQN